MMNSSLANSFIIDITSLMVANAANSPRFWILAIATASGRISEFTADYFVVQSHGFLNEGGVFSISQSLDGLSVNLTCTGTNGSIRTNSCLRVQEKRSPIAWRGPVREHIVEQRTGFCR